MPNKDPDKQRKYQREWVAKRRKEWFDANGPCIDCGTWGTDGNQLELDHTDAATKVTHSIWSFSKENREKELVKCVVRCHLCHVVKTTAMGERPRGERNGWAILTSDQVLEIRARYKHGQITQSQLAQEYVVKRETITSIINRRSWKHLD